MRECFYLLAMTYNMLPYSGPANLRRDLSASLFILTETEFKKRVSVFCVNANQPPQSSNPHQENNYKSNVFRIENINLDINTLI